ncbi:MAG: hypothetical protein LJE83_01210 [Gammaproteobacteria bacterium]|nr:hypothetical protein [Gammaproteobacteria bacterium]
MSGSNDSKALNGLLIKPGSRAEEDQLAKIREHQRRERKEKLYSSGLKNH